MMLELTTIAALAANEHRPDHSRHVKTRKTMAMGMNWVLPGHLTPGWLKELADE
jgi:hypothetical protein